jgi:hypothetical protein
MGSILVAGLDPAFAHFGIARMRLDMETLGLSLERIRTVVTEKMAGKRKVVRQNSDDLRRAGSCTKRSTRSWRAAWLPLGKSPQEPSTRAQRSVLASL